jgi:hypothetical protein
MRGHAAGDRVPRRIDCQTSGCACQRSARRAGRVRLAPAAIQSDEALGSPSATHLSGVQAVAVAPGGENSSTFPGRGGRCLWGILKRFERHALRLRRPREDGARLLKSGAGTDTMDLAIAARQRVTLQMISLATVWLTLWV